MANENKGGIFSRFTGSRQNNEPETPGEVSMANNPAEDQPVSEENEIIRAAREKAEDIVAAAKAENERLLAENARLASENAEASAENARVQKEYDEKKETLRLNEEAQKIIDEHDQFIASAMKEAQETTDNARSEAASIVSSAEKERDRVNAEFEERKASLMLNDEAQGIIDAKEQLIREGTAKKEEAEKEAGRIIDEANRQSMETVNQAIRDAEEKKSKASVEAEGIIRQARTDMENEKAEAEKTAKGIVGAAKAEAETIIANAREEAKVSASEILTSAQSEEKKIIGRKEAAAEAVARSIRETAESEAERIRNSANEYADRKREEASQQAIAICQSAEQDAENTKADAQKVIEAQQAAIKTREEKLHEDEIAVEVEKAKIPEITRSRVEEKTEAVRKKLEEREKALSTKEGELKEKERDLQWKKESLESEKQSFNQSLENAIEQRYSTVCGELKASKENEGRLVAANKELNDKYHRLTVLYRESQGEDSQRLREERDDYKAKLDAIESCNIFDHNARAVRTAADETVKLWKEVEKLRAQLADARNKAAVMAGAEDKLAVAEDNVSTYQQMVDHLVNELNERKRVTRGQMIAPIQEPPRFLTGAQPRKAHKALESEIKWLDHILEQSKKSGIILSRRFLYAYHTTLKINEWSPLVVLAGVSGTGKSELPRQYARHGGMHFVSIPVKPDWDSPSSLFGYFNAIENRFEATEVVRALYQMQSNQERADDMLLVLLDEMNLAHPEQYFADLLSKFEEARNAESYSEYDIALGSGEQPERLMIGRNVLWTGTMNEDETTKGLSDKVVDRSMLITFPCPEKLFDRDNTPLQPPQMTLSFQKWNEWKADALKRDANQEVEELLKKKKETIQKINTSMSQMGRNLGHRVWQSIENYILNYPTVISGDKKTDEMEKAFCDAVAFKMMPKLRGLETRGRNEEHLGAIRDLLPENMQKDFENACDQTSEVFRWNSAKFMEE